MPFESKVEVRVMTPDRNIASVKVLKSSTTLDVYQVGPTMYPGVLLHSLSTMACLSMMSTVCWLVKAWNIINSLMQKHTKLHMTKDGWLV